MWNKTCIPECIWAVIQITAVCVCDDELCVRSVQCVDRRPTKLIAWLLEKLSVLLWRHGCAAETWRDRGACSLERKVLQSLSLSDSCMMGNNLSWVLSGSSNFYVAQHKEIKRLCLFFLIANSLTCHELSIFLQCFTQTATKLLYEGNLRLTVPQYTFQHFNMNQNDSLKCFWEATCIQLFIQSISNKVVQYKQKFACKTLILNAVCPRFGFKLHSCMFYISFIIKCLFCVVN